jgi:hypothetical protein
MSLAGHQLPSICLACPSSDCRASSSWEFIAIASALARTSVCPWPINAPALAREWRPNQFLRGCSLGVVIQRSRAFVEAAGVPGIAESKLQEVQVMAELVVQRVLKNVPRQVIPLKCVQAVHIL